MQIAARINQYDPIAVEVARSRARAYRGSAVDQAGASVSQYPTLTLVPRQTVNETAADGQTLPAMSLSSSLAVLDVNALLEGGALPLAAAPAAFRSAPPSVDPDGPDSIDGLLSRVLAVG